MRFIEGKAAGNKRISFVLESIDYIEEIVESKTLIGFECGKSITLHEEYDEVIKTVNRALGHRHD